MEILKVSSKSNPNLVAGALVNILKEDKKAEVHSIGAGALNQAIKSLAIARGYLTPSGKDLTFTPSFLEVTIEGEVKTAIKLEINLV
jgi:stage V sporulation protein S